jgi:hypothetical protein
MKSKLEQHAEILRQLDGTNTDLGWFENATYPTGESVAAVMMSNEFGSAGSATKAPTPARPLLRQTAAVLDEKVPAYIERRKMEMMEGKLTVPEYRKKLGEAMVAAGLETLKKGDFEKNAESTVKQKGFDKPLVDTGLLGQSLTYRNDAE